MAGLQFVMTKLLEACDQGIIKKNNNTGASKFALVMRRNIGQKLSKQQKSKELIKVLRTHRKQILDRLMRDSVLGSDDRIEEKIESIFIEMRQKQESNMQAFFAKVESNLDSLKGEIGDIKEYVETVQTSIEENNQQKKPAFLSLKKHT